MGLEVKRVMVHQRFTILEKTVKSAFTGNMMRFYNLFKDIEIIPQAKEQFGMVPNHVFLIPWGHIKLLIDKCHANPAKFDFYVDKVIENNWSRAVLLNFTIGISEYELNALMPKDFKGTLPTIEELEKGLGDK